MDTINTITGKLYVVLADAPAQISSSLDGVTYTLLSHPGDGSALSFVAVSASVSVVCSGHYTVTESFSSAPASAVGGGVREEDVIELIDDALLRRESTECSTVADGSSNVAWRCAIINQSYLVTGKLHSIKIPFRSHDCESSESIYLGVQMSDDASSWVDVAISTNAVTEVVNGFGLWLFSGELLEGKHMRVYPCLAADKSFNGSVLAGGRCVPASEADGISRLQGRSIINHLLGLVVESYIQLPIYAEVSSLSTKVDASVFNAHSDDGLAHLSQTEHEGLTNLIATCDGAQPAWTAAIDGTASGVATIQFAGGACIRTYGANDGDIIIQPASNSHARLENVYIHGSATLNEVALATVNDIRPGKMEVHDAGAIYLGGALDAGKLYKLLVLTDADMSTASFIAPSGECWTCEIGLDLTNAMEGVTAGIVWPTTWLWIDTVDGLPPADLAIGKWHYFALRSEGARTYINQSYSV